MKKQLSKIAIVTAIFGMTFTSCDSVQNSNKTQRGTAIGAGAGGVIGGILGNNIGKGGNTVLGAAIGAAVGGAAGGIIGNKMDKQATAIENALPGAEVERVEEGIRVVLNEESINFDFNSSELTPKAMENLNKLIPALNKEPDTNLQIQGYTDSKGPEDYNLKLSQERAQSVYNYLVANGVAASRLTTVGFGETHPVASNDTDEGRAKNRRVEFIITANDKMKAEAEQQAKEEGK